MRTTNCILFYCCFWLSLVNLNLISTFFIVPTQKMPRLLSTSASACRRLLAKAELMGIDVAALEFQEAQVNISAAIPTFINLVGYE